ncbi:hypothetical protein NLG97_g583 [Lecanicillium saksenae]|uniref:Uncharacterized protein n=1 Tax=Lecanicillium saksenae TaxID=468837 RepID=A0ACC1R826_9HYPO|nr:hypothetical protein NLG97_g583 [Lecanicillium saksenae]
MRKINDQPPNVVNLPHVSSGEETEMETETVAGGDHIREEAARSASSPRAKPGDDRRGEERDDAVCLDIEETATDASRRNAFNILSKKKTNEQFPSTVLPLMDLENGIVGWESQDDPAMPLNFTPFRKWLMLYLLSAITFMTPWSSSILAPAVEQIESEFHVKSAVLGSMPVSIFLLGYAVGPLVLSPLSEIYGRNIIMITSNLFFCLWLIGCALAPSIDTLIFFRFMCGVGGSACQTVGGAIISDLFQISQRGKATTIWMLGPILGPSLAPVVGGFVAQTIRWRWANWISFIPGIIVIAAMVFGNKETNARVLMQAKTEKLRAGLNRPELRSCYIDRSKPVLTTRQHIFLGLTRPIKMLFQSAILFSLSLYIAFNYGCLYLLFNTMPTVFFGNYGWSLGVSSLPYFSLMIGYMISITIFAIFSDRTVMHMTKANGGIYEPEMRIPYCTYFAILIPISFFWYGWAAAKQTHWIIPVIGIIPFSAGFIGIWIPANSYIIDAFPEYAASALAGFAVLRCTIGAFLPLAAPSMYGHLGLGWGNSLLGFIALAFVPVPFLIYRYGRWMRQRWPIKT